MLAQGDPNPPPAHVRLVAIAVASVAPKALARLSFDNYLQTGEGLFRTRRAKALDMVPAESRRQRCTSYKPVFLNRKSSQRLR